MSFFSLLKFFFRFENFRWPTGCVVPGSYMRYRLGESTSTELPLASVLFSAAAAAAASVAATANDGVSAAINRAMLRPPALIGQC